MVTVKQVQALVVRGCLCLHFVLVVWRVTVSWTDRYWLLAPAILPFLMEGFYTVVKRGGVEWKLFSLCFFFYLCATLPGIWLLEIKKTLTYQKKNYTQVDDLVINGVEIPIRLTPDTWVLVVEEMMLYLMILARWVLPRGDVGREQLTQLLFGFVGIASDIMELFSLFDEGSGIRHDTILTYIILGVWSLSVLQFTLTFATSHRPRRSRGMRVSPGVTIEEDKGDADDSHKHRLSVLRMELLATVLSLFMQDGPFLGVRLYTIIHYNIITYSLVFFTCKNALVILLLVYKIFLLLNKVCCPKHHDDDLEDLDEEEEEEADGFHQTDSEKICTKSKRNGNVYDLESGGMRKRGKDRKNCHSSTDLSFQMMEPGELQKVIDGPATPAKSMKKSKMYDRHIVDDKMLEVVEGDAALDENEQCSAEVDNTLDNSNSDEPCREDADAETKAQNLPSTTSPEASNSMLTSDDKQNKEAEEDAHMSNGSDRGKPPTPDSTPQNDRQPDEQNGPGLNTGSSSPEASSLHSDIHKDVLCLPGDAEDTMKTAEKLHAHGGDMDNGQQILVPVALHVDGVQEDGGKGQHDDEPVMVHVDASSKTHDDTCVKEQHADNSDKEQTPDTSGQEQTADTLGKEQAADTSGQEQTANTSGQEQTADTSGQEQTADILGKEQTADISGQEQTADTLGEEQHTDSSNPQPHKLKQRVSVLNIKL